MGNYLRLVLASVLLFTFACAPDGGGGDDGGAPAGELGPNASIIRIPVDAEGEVDSVNVARLDFAETEYRFGTVASGEVVEHVFTFTNEGRVPLLITGTHSTCGCTVADYPREPIPPGEGGAVSVRFDTKNKSGGQRKPVTITANTYPATTTVYVSGRVTES